MKTTIHAELPTELVSEARGFVRAGWVNGLDDLLAEALRRFLESHSSELTEEFLRQDVEWGLNGHD